MPALWVRLCLPTYNMPDTSSTPVKWGLVSTARINRRLIPALRMSARAELMAVASRNSEVAKDYAQEWQIPHSYGSYTELFENDNIDAVYISVPNHLHIPLTIEALQHGKAVLCEKPFALEPEDVDRVRAIKEETNGIVAEAFMYRHHPQTKMIGQIITDGNLGKILSMHASFHFKLTNQQNVRLRPEWGGGCLWDVGIYPVSLFQYLMQGPPTQVYGHQILGESGVDIHFVGHMQYTNHVSAQFSSSFASSFGMQATIVGELGRLEISRPFTGLQEPDNRTVHIRNDGTRKILQIPDEYLYLGEVEDINDAVLNGKANYISLDETKNHIKTAQALYVSAKEGKIVDML